MALNRIELGTKCTVRTTGEVGILKKIYFYPTKYELEFSKDRIGHYSIRDLEIDGIQQSDVKRIVPKVPDKGIGERWSYWSPFKGQSQIKHHFSTSKEIMWTMLTSIDMYNVWFHGIQRALPVMDTERYVHRYSFDKFILKPGEFFKIRPQTLAPYFNCRILTLEKEKAFGFTFQTTPLYKEYIHFTMEESENGVWVTISRKVSGFFSFLAEVNWEKKSKSLIKLEKIIPVTTKNDIIDSTDSTKNNNLFGGFASKQDYINYAINMGMQGDMDFINSIKEKPIRGMAKAGVVKAKRTGILPPMPEKSSEPDGAKEDSGVSSLSKDDMIAYLVNKGLDGDMDAVNNHDDKVVRAKTKAMMVKIKRGKIEKPPMPTISEAPVNQSKGVNSFSKDDMIAYLVNKGLDGDMDAVNNHDDKVVRAKTKAMMVKIKRGKIEKPPMPNLDSEKNETSGKSDLESEESLMERLIAKGIEGDMDEINNLDNKVLRGKIKAAIVKEKRSKK